MVALTSRMQHEFNSSDGFLEKRNLRRLNIDPRSPAMGWVIDLCAQALREIVIGIGGKIGEVESATLIIDQMSGRSKGFGFVEMASDEDAAKAISELNGTTLIDRTITVNEARPKKERGGGGGRGGRGGGGYGGGRGRSW